MVTIRYYRFLKNGLPQEKRVPSIFALHICPQRKKMQRDIMHWIKLPGSPTFFNQISLFPDFPKVLTHTGQQKIDFLGLISNTAKNSLKSSKSNVHDHHPMIHDTLARYINHSLEISFNDHHPMVHDLPINPYLHVGRHTICWPSRNQRVFQYLCICVFVYLYLCIPWFC